jgi:imidazole glycerol-phosphate synthase subunit HisH
MIGIVDYGMGNLASVENALDNLGYATLRCSGANQIDSCERIVLPGVGSYQAAMAALESGGWVDAIRDFAQSGRPLLGICLGMQLLFDCGEEHGSSPGLGLIPGEVVGLKPPFPLKVPHVGWNSLEKATDHPLLEGVRSNVDVYFVHSYHCIPLEKSDVIADCNFGVYFVAAVARGNVAGMQFHPEKSQLSGLRMLGNFAEWDGQC